MARKPDVKELLAAYLKELHLPAFRTSYEELARQAQQESLSFEQYLLGLAERECQERRNKRVERLLRQSRLPLEKNWQSLDLKRLPPKATQQVRSLLEGGFANRHENVLIFGNPGSGKTHVACAIGQELIRAGRKVTFATCGLMVQDLLGAKRDLKLRGFLKKISRYEVLILDDIGYVQYSREEMERFAADPGTVTALVGSSGSGKSTIISLICAFHKPDKGAVLVDGIDLSNVRLDDYRGQLGVVLQESFLFDGSIRDNVLFSDPDATEEQFLTACRIARVDEFAERFPEAYDTIVGERGVKLSGGQRQRLSIARAILANPGILILDEATSSLDSESEAMIQEGLSFLMQGRTTFVIAHRLSTIRRADQILVVEGGYIVERGTHESLYALGGRYFDLYTRQHGLETNLFLAPGEGDVVEEAK